MYHSNQFKKSIEDGNVVLGARAASFSPALIEIYGSMDLDFVWLDFEHAGVSPWDSTVFENLSRAAEVANIELLVRIPTSNESLIRKVLDSGIRNILVPRVDTADEVRKIVEASRFVYEGSPGQRGFAHERSSGYGTKPDNEYIQHEDKNVCVGVMIEKASSLKSIKEILSVPGLGFVFIGKGDLSVQLGYPGNQTHQRVQEAVSKVEEESKRNGTPLGGISHDGEKARNLRESGYQIIRIGGEFESAKHTINARMEEYHDESD